MRKESFEEDFENSPAPLNGFLDRYLPYWPIFIGLIIFAIMFAFVYLRYATPIFETTSKVLIKDEKKGLNNSEIMESFDLFGSKKIVENEIEIIKSIELTSAVVRNLKLYAPITSEGKIVNVSAYTGTPVLIEFLHPDSIIEVKKVYFSYDFDKRKVIIQDNVYPINHWVRTHYGIIRFVPNPNYVRADQSRPLYFSLISVYKVANDLLERLVVEAASKQSSIIYIRMKDAIPQRAENIINELILVYNKAAIQDKNILAANTLEFVNERLIYVLLELDSVENRLQRYKNANKIVDISEQGKLFLESSERSSEEIGRNAVQLAVLDEVQQYVTGSNTKKGIIPSTLGVTDPILAGLLDRLYNAEIKYESLRKTTAENNPIILALAEEIDLIKPKIIQNIATQRRSLQVGTATINTEKNKYSSILSTIPQKEKELLQISRQQSIKSSIYTFLLQKREETALSLAATTADSRLVDRAHSTIYPISPRKLSTILLAIAIGIGLGFAFINFREILNRNILFRAEIESFTSAPIIGEIGYDKSNLPIVISQGDRNVIAEQFRQLRTSLSYININSTHKKILVTSTISGEGKSFISANLGMTLALAGKKVILIELDLRKPKLSSLFGLKSELGITNYFIGDVRPENMILPSSLHNDLFIIPSGPIPPNPSELILNGRLNDLLVYLEDIFDFIIIDTAPVSPVTDAYIISPFCDATLFVIRHGVTSKTSIKKLDNNSKIGGLKNLAIIFNGVKNRGLGKYGYLYGYGYGNGNGGDYHIDSKR